MDGSIKKPKHTGFAAQLIPARIVQPSHNKQSIERIAVVSDNFSAFQLRIPGTIQSDYSVDRFLTMEQIISYWDVYIHSNNQVSIEWHS